MDQLLQRLHLQKMGTGTTTALPENQAKESRYTPMGDVDNISNVARSSPSMGRSEQRPARKRQHRANRKRTRKTPLEDRPAIHTEREHRPRRQKALSHTCGKMARRNKQENTRMDQPRWTAYLEHQEKTENAKNGPNPTPDWKLLRSTASRTGTEKYTYVHT